MTSAKKWMGVTLVTTLVIGMGAGILLDRLVLVPTVDSRTSDSERSGERRHRDRGHRMGERLHSRLGLTDEQVARLEEVMSENHETARQFWRNSREEFETLRQQFRADIRELLTEEQRVAFDEMVAEYEAKSHRDLGGRRGER